MMDDVKTTQQRRCPVAYAFAAIVVSLGCLNGMHGSQLPQMLYLADAMGRFVVGESAWCGFVSFRYRGAWLVTYASQVGASTCQY